MKITPLCIDKLLLKLYQIRVCFARESEGSIGEINKKTGGQTV